MTTVFAAIVIDVLNGSRKLVMETTGYTGLRALVPLVDQHNGCKKIAAAEP